MEDEIKINGVKYRKVEEPKSEDPKVFENSHYEIRIDKEELNITNKYVNQLFDFNNNESLPLLIKAIDRWKELQDE